MQELNLFKIEGSVGGNQDWFRDFWMKKGGCGAVRQLTEFILNARGDWEKIVNSYLQEGQGDAH